MGRPSKAKQNRLNSLRHTKNWQNSTVEDITEEENTDSDQLDNLLEEGFFSPDKGPGLDGDSDEEDEEEDESEELYGPKDESGIDRFNAILFHAQAIAVKAEREAAGEKPKRKPHYTGNSKRTMQHHAQKR
jgi:hypothetical protein